MKALREWIEAHPVLAWVIVAALGLIAGGLFIAFDGPQGICFFIGGFTFICGSNALDEWEQP